MRFTCPLAFLFLLGSANAVLASQDLLIGVLSPTTAGRAIGIAHEETVRFAFGRVGATIEVDGRAFPLRVAYENDRGDPEVAVARARDLVERGAVAIVGPIDSMSTKAVLDAGLGIPVISALATAPALSRPRDKWFFRMTLSDDQRMWHLMRTVYGRSMMPQPILLLYDDGNSYGEGLRDALSAEIAPTPESIGWSAIVEGGTIGPSNRDDVFAGRGLLPGFRAQLAASPPRTVLALGPNLRAVPIARGVDALLRAQGAQPPEFYFVGADADLRNSAPVGSYTIGEPTVIDGNDGRAGKTRGAFLAERKRDADSFIVTAFEAAYYVLPRALAEAVRTAIATSQDRDGALPTPPVLRELLRAQLESLEFESLEPARRITLRDGTLTGAPNVPVLKVQREFELVDVPVPSPWLEVEGPEHAGFLTGPVVIRVRGHYVPDDLQLSVVRTDAGASEVVSSTTRALGNGTWEVSFYPSWPGTYGLDSKPVATMSPKIPARVSLDRTYLLALLGAVAGSLLFIFSVTERGGSVSPKRVLLGMVAGVALAGLALHRALLPEGFPLPTFGESPEATAVWAGFAGGWLGPGVLLLALTRLLPGGIGEKPPSGGDANVAAPITQTR